MDQNQENEPKSFYALVELLGHARAVGFLTETTLGGAGFLKLDVPNSDGSTAFTRLIAPGAVYQISPIDKEIALELSTRWDQTRIESYDVPQLRLKLREEIRKEIEEGQPARAHYPEDQETEF